jgi:hypothetical protein
LFVCLFVCLFVGGSSGKGSAEDVAALFPAAARDKAVFLDHVLKVLLYQRPLLGSKPLTPLEAAAAAAGATDVSGDIL